MFKILVIDDKELTVQFLKQNLSARGYEVLVANSGEDGVEIYKEELPDLVLLDLKLPGIDGIETLSKVKEIDSEALVVMITAYGEITTAVKAIKTGAYDYLEKPFGFDQVIHLIQNALETTKLKREVKRIRNEQKGMYGFDNVIGKSKAMRNVFKMVKRIAQSDASIILIHGESGTGKDVIARAIHCHSPMSENPFVEINCTSLPENLIESELFGHEKSAFTDAKAMKRGLFELADGGTIFLDEIGDMSMSTQAKLLRVVEGKAFKRVGGLTDINVDVRIIGATNKDLLAAVKDGTFREDLYYRLMVIPVYIPPLRERREDIIPLTKFFIDEFSKNIKGRIKKISKEVEDLLMGYRWPGNVRELRNMLERISILEAGNTLLPEHLPEELKGKRFEPLEEGSAGFIFPEEGISLESVERSLIKQALNMSMGNQSNAAKLLSLTRDTLRYRMRKFGLE